MALSASRAAAAIALVLAIAAITAPAAPGAKRKPHWIGASALASYGGAVLVAIDHDPRAEALLRGHGATPTMAAAGIWRVGSMPAPLVDRLAGMGVLRSVSDADARITPAVSGWASEPLTMQAWWLGAIGAAGLTPPGTGVPLNVVDSGVDLTHPDFAGRPATQRLNAQAPADDHGTSVASVAAAALNGVGIAGLYPSVLLRTWDYGDGSCQNVVAGVDTAAAAAGEVGVINLSGGFARPGVCPALYDAIMYAFGRGALVVAAARNDPGLASPQAYPASIPHVLTVGATDRSGNPLGPATPSLGVDLTAPGEDIPVAVRVASDPSNPWRLASGTSIAAPLVSAAAAWAWTQRGGYERADQTQMFELVRRTATDVGPRGWDAATGFGVLNMPALLGGALPPSDHSEPNEDIYQVRESGLFREAAPPLLPRGRSAVSVRATVDVTEDPIDVYRVFVPANRRITVTVRTSSNVDLELFRPSARTVHYRNRAAALRTTLVGGSYRTGNRAERLVARNSARVGAFFYVCVFKPTVGQQARRATYTLTARISR